MNYIVDIILVALVVITVGVAVKKGFITTLIETFSFLISAFAAKEISPLVSNWAYEAFIRDTVEKSFNNILSGAASGMSMQAKANELLSDIPEGMLKLAELTGTDINALASTVSAQAATNDQLVQNLIDKVVYNIVTSVSQAIFFIVLFILFTIILSIVAKLFKKVNKIPLLGKVNEVLGGVIGVIKAVIIVFVICTIMYIVVGVMDENAFVDAVVNSKIYSFICEYNPVVKML